MYTFDPTFQPDPGEMRLFATSRPSRLCEVAGAEPVFARRKEQDMAWAAAIGIDPERGSAKRAREDGFEVVAPAEAAKRGDYLQILTPDETQGELYEQFIAPYLTKGKVLGFSHGFAIHFKTVVPPADVDVVMIAPKSPGHLVRRQYAEGRGVPAVIAIHQDVSGKAHELALAYADGIGSTRAGVLQTTFKEETETDLFGEQAVLCGGLTSLIKKGFETLVEAGYQPEIAYFEVLHEMKLIVDLIYEGGLDRMRFSISNTAEFGDLTRGDAVVGDATRQAMKKVLAEIQDGTFAREWIAEYRGGNKNFTKLREAEKKLQVEEVGAKLRSMMDWLPDATKSTVKKETTATKTVKA